MKREKIRSLLEQTSSEPDNSTLHHPKSHDVDGSHENGRSHNDDKAHDQQSVNDTEQGI